MAIKALLNIADAFVVRVAAKELTSLILDEERLRAERSDRKTWKSRVTGLEEYPPPGAEQSTRPRRERREASDGDDAEYRLALEASKYQEEEDRKRREDMDPTTGEDDDDLAKAIKLSKEEDERRRRQLEESFPASLFDDDLIQTSQPQPTGSNQGYQQGNQVDFFANPIDQDPAQEQQTGFMSNTYTGYPQQQQQQQQQTSFQPNYSAFGMQPGMQGVMATGMGNDPYGQQLNQQQQFPVQSQVTGYNPYAQQQAQQAQPPMAEPLPSGSNNPWATNNNQMRQQAVKPTATGSNNPFAQNRPSSTRPTLSTLSSLPEQKTLATFGNPSQPSFQSQPSQASQQQPSFSQQPTFNTPQKELSEHEQKLNSLLATSDGMDTYGNTGDLRIPSQHTAPGTFVNSAGSGLNRLAPEATGNNPFMRQQFTGMPSTTYNGQSGGNNPFGSQPSQPQQRQQQQNQDLIQF